MPIDGLLMILLLVQIDLQTNTSHSATFFITAQWRTKKLYDLEKAKETVEYWIYEWNMVLYIAGFNENVLQCDSLNWAKES